MKLSLTPGFVQGIASTLHSSFMMPAWELLQWKMARKHSYKPTTYRLEIVCSREQNKQWLKLVTSQKLESSGFYSSEHFMEDLHIRENCPDSPRNLAVKGLISFCTRERDNSASLADNSTLAVAPAMLFVL